MEHRVNASARFLDYGCRLTLINSVIFSLPAYYIWTVNKTIIKNFDRVHRHCLWDKIKDRDSPSVNALTAWSLVCRPKRHSGLGILNIETIAQFFLNEILLGSLWSGPCMRMVPLTLSPRAVVVLVDRSRDVFSLVDIYRSITQGIARSGENLLFSKDVLGT